MSAEKLWQLDTPIAPGWTHLQIAAFKVEVDRAASTPAVAGYVDIWWVLSYYDTDHFRDVVVETSGSPYRIEGGAYTALRAAVLDVHSLADAECALYPFLAGIGVFPPGHLVNQR